MLYLSTTFFGKEKTKLSKVIDFIKKNNFQIDGIEIGSTHTFENLNFKKILNNLHTKYIMHNYYPFKKKYENFVINLSSQSSDIRLSSINFLKNSLNYCSDLGIKEYTIHPGFVYESTPNISKNNYDFTYKKNEIFHKSLDLFCMSFDIIKNVAIKNKINLYVETQGSRTSNLNIMLQKPEEYYYLLNKFKYDIGFNLNLAHSYLASIQNNFDLKNFLNDILDNIFLVELSHNNSFLDEHLPLIPESYVFKYLDMIKDKKLILEFRNSLPNDIHKSIDLIKKKYEAN